MPWQHHDNIYMGAFNIRQLRDPVLPQDAATKQYADTAANEVVIQRDEPRDVRAELWVDWDEAGSTALEQEVYVTLAEPAPPWELWADLSGVMPPGGGPAVPTEEVFIQDTAPTAVTAELWMDMSVPDPLDAMARIIADLSGEVARMRLELDAFREGST